MSSSEGDISHEIAVFFHVSRENFDFLPYKVSFRTYITVGRNSVTQPLSTKLPMTPSSPLTIFRQCLTKVPDPRSKHGQSHAFPVVLALVFLGLLAQCTTPTAIQRWTNIHCETLRQFFRIRKQGVPSVATLIRILKKLSLSDLQLAFAEFVNAILQDTTLIAAVDGKTAKQMKDENGDPLLMLNVFAQKLKLHLASWSVQGDKTNEPGCLKMHLQELFEMYPCLKLLTGDAIYAQRPLLEALQEYHCDYLCQVKSNQPKILAKMTAAFADAPKQETQNSRTHDCRRSKKKGLWKSVVCG